MFLLWLMGDGDAIDFEGGIRSDAHDWIRRTTLQQLEWVSLRLLAEIKKMCHESTFRKGYLSGHSGGVSYGLFLAVERSRCGWITLTLRICARLTVEWQE